MGIVQQKHGAADCSDFDVANKLLETFRCYSCLGPAQQSGIDLRVDRCLTNKSAMVKNVRAKPSVC
jgi:hypothetical protein